MATASASDSLAPAAASAAPAAPPPDLEALLNRANLALARSRQLVASWLPAPDAAAGGTDGDSVPDDEADDAALFAPVPEL